MFPIPVCNSVTPHPEYPVELLALALIHNLVLIPFFLSLCLPDMIKFTVICRLLKRLTAIYLLSYYFKNKIFVIFHKLKNKSQSKRSV